MALRTLDCSLSVAIINLLGEGGNHQPDPEGTFLLGAKGDILTGLQHHFSTRKRRRLRRDRSSPLLAPHGG